MNILLLTSKLDSESGWAVVSRYLYAALRKKHSVTTLTYKDLSAESYFNPLSLLKDYRTSSKTLRNEKFDGILCIVEELLPLAALLKRKLGIPRLILVGHGTYIYYPFVTLPKKLVMKIFVKAIDGIVVPSKFTLKKLREWYSGEAVVVPWGVDTKVYYSKRVKKEMAFVFVGMQKERKGVSYLFAAVKKLKEQFPKLRVFMVGVSNPKYKKLASQLKIKKNIIFLGRTSHEALLRCYAKSLANILPSVNVSGSFEGFGLVHLEANACGIPSIGSKGTANEEVIIHGKTGFLCNQRDSDDLAKKMLKIIKNKKAWELMCKASLDHAKRMTWERSAKLIERELLR